MDNIPKLSSKEYLILDLLIGRGEMFGLELVESAPGKLARGTVYVTLSRMGEKGFVTSRMADDPAGGPPRRMYSPTGHGKYVFNVVQKMAASSFGEEAFAL